MTHWRKSSFSAEDANCVEVAHSTEVAAVRDSKNREGPHLVVSADAFRQLRSRLCP
jgi:hypothetical protein